MLMALKMNEGKTMERIERTAKEHLFVGFMWASIVLVLLLTGDQYMRNEAADKGTVVKSGSWGQPQEQVSSPDDRIAALNSRIAMNPRDLDALIQLGDVHYDSRRFPEALSIFARAEKLAPGNVHVLSDLGALNRAIGNFDLAISKYKAAFEANPAHLESLYHMGSIYLDNMGDSEKADALFKQVLADSPNEELRHTVEDALNRVIH